MNSPILTKSRCTCPKQQETKRPCKCIKNSTRNPVTFETIFYSDEEDPDEIIFRALGRANEIDTWTNRRPAADNERGGRPDRKGRAKPRNRHPRSTTDEVWERDNS